MSLTPGTRLGHYEVIAPLGAGGMGEVFLARDVRLGRNVALKILPASLVADPDRVRRFEQEARAASALNHPNAVTLFDVGQAGDRGFIASEYVEGRTLRAVLDDRRTVPPAEALAIVRQCASALAAAHGAGIVHRDIKPENVMIRQDGVVKVLDFGLAKMAEPSAPDDETVALRTPGTSAGVVLGTFGYLSPEQARGQAVDGRTDVFSLGVVLFELLTGVQPFRGETPSDTLAAVLRAEPPPLASLVAGLPAPLQSVVDRALAKDRERRYPSMVDFSRALEQSARDLEPGSASGARAAQAPSTWRTALIVAGVIAVLTVAAIWLWPSRDVAVATPPVKTLAVLPFGLLGFPSAEDHVGVGMADALIVKLTPIRQLTVRPTTAVLRYQGVSADTATVARELRVDAVLTGTMQRAAGRVRVTVQLVGPAGSGSDMRSIWSDEFTTSTDDPFEVQDQLTARLVEKLALQLTGDERSRLSRQDTTDARALQLYLEGRFFLNKRTPEAYSRADELFSAATARDPKFAKAFYGQAVASNGLIASGARTPAAAGPTVKARLASALALDPDLGDAYALRSHVIRLYDWEFAQADVDSERSIALDPNSPEVLNWRGVHLLAMGRGAEAVTLHERAVEIDPLDINARSQLCRALYFAKRYDDAIRTGQAIVAIDPAQSAAHQWIGQSLVESGRFAEALPVLERAVALAPGNTERLAALAHGYARSRRPAEAQALMVQIVPPNHDYHLATIAAGLGDVSGAAAALDRAWQGRDAYMANRALVDPKLDPVRNDPRVQAVLRRLR